MGGKAAFSLLEETLNEERAADMQLTDIAEHYVNWQALENESGQLKFVR